MYLAVKGMDLREHGFGRTARLIVQENSTIVTDADAQTVLGVIVPRTLRSMK